MTKDYAEIVTIDELKKKLPWDENAKTVVTSGGFDPIHPGHVSSIIESKKHGDILIVVVNGDWFLKNKKGKPFQDLATRCDIVAGIRYVDYVVPFEIENDSSVSKALEVIKPKIFTKGGDRNDVETLAEYPTCQRLGIEIVSKVGRAKDWSSSDFLEDWGKFYSEKNAGV